MTDIEDQTASPADETAPAAKPAKKRAAKKAAAKRPSKPAGDTVAITFSVEHTTRDGVTHKPDTVAELSAAEARNVLHIGHGRTTAPKGNAS